MRLRTVPLINCSNNYCKMDTKIEIKGEDLFSDDLILQNETERVLDKIKTNDDVFLDSDGCKMAMKTEIKSESPLPDLSSQKGIECFTKQIKFESVTCDSNYGVVTKTEIEERPLDSDFGLQNQRMFLPKSPLMEVKKYNSDQELDNEIKVEEEPSWCLQTEISSVWDNVKGEDLPSASSSRLCRETISGASSDKCPLSSDQLSGNDTVSDPVCEIRRSDVTVMSTIVPKFRSETSGKCRDGSETYSETSSMKQKDLVYTGAKLQKCKVGDKCALTSHTKQYEFTNISESKHSGNISTHLSNFKNHILINEVQKPHKCTTCGKSFIWLSQLNRHKLIHEGKKPFMCKICGKNFTQLSHLKLHYLTHEGIKPHKCKICDKTFSDLSNLKHHNLIHDGNKVHQCKTCHKSFTWLSSFKRHNLIHEGKKPHQCNICDKSFTELSHLKMHKMMHEGQKPHKCKICDKSFSVLSGLNRHNLIHESNKAHKCKICDKSFTHLSNLKVHNLIHEGTRPHQCNTCGKSFTQLSNLKKHSSVHTDKKLHVYKTCDMGFT